MNLEDILNEWKEDGKIDEFNLDSTTVKCAILHAKYLELFSISKLKLRKKESDLSILKKDKWLYYNGKMDKEEMDKRGWPYDPFNGLSKPMKSDMDRYYDTDKDIIRAKEQIEYQKVITETLDEIIGTIRWRHQNIRNILDFKKFTAGC